MVSPLEVENELLPHHLISTRREAEDSVKRERTQRERKRYGSVATATSWYVDTAGFLGTHAVRRRYGEELPGLQNPTLETPSKYVTENPTVSAISSFTARSSFTSFLRRQSSIT